MNKFWWYLWVITLSIAISDFIYVIFIRKELFDETPSIFALIFFISLVISGISFLLAILFSIIKGNLKNKRKIAFRKIANVSLVTIGIIIGFILNLFILKNVIAFFRNIESNSTSQNATSVSIPSPAQASFNQNKLWELINNWRKEQGYEPYKEHFQLCELTFERLKETKSNWSSIDFSTRKINFYYNSLSENLAKDYPNEQATLNSWLSNLTTSKQLKDNSQYSCLRCDRDRCVQLIANIGGGGLNGNVGNTNYVNNTLPTLDPDPVINCNVHINCGGGTRQLKRSICYQSTCCQIGKTWLFYESSSKCTQDQNAYNNQQRQNYTYSTLAPLPTFSLPNYYPCTLYYPALHSYQTYNSLYKTKEECDIAQAKLNQDSSSSQNSNPVYSAPQMTKSQCQSNVNDKYRSTMTSNGCAYPCPSSGDCGTSSVCEALWSQAQKEMESCNQYP